MSINGINRAAPLRMMGLSSGMDTDFIIQQTMRLHQLKIDQRMRARTLIDWRLQEHNKIRDDIRSFRSTFFNSNALWSMNSYNTHKATVTGTNTSAVTIRTNAQSTLGDFSILSTQQARGTHYTTTGRVSPDGAGYAMNTRITELGAIEFSEDIFKIADSDKTEANPNLKIFDVYRDSSGDYWVNAYGSTQRTKLEFDPSNDNKAQSFKLEENGADITLRLSNGNLQRVDQEEVLDEDGNHTGDYTPRYTTFGVAEFGKADITIDGK